VRVAGSGAWSVDSGDGMCILLDVRYVGMHSNRWLKTSRSHHRRPRSCTVVFGVFLPASLLCARIEGIRLC